MERFIAVDVETANADASSICSIGTCVAEDALVRSVEGTLVDPESFFDDGNTEIHGLSAERVRGAPRFPDVLAGLGSMVGDAVVVSHTPFARIAIERAAARYGLPRPWWRWLDSARVARRQWQALPSFGLRHVGRHCGFEWREHDSREDARTVALVVVRAMEESGLALSEWLRKVEQPITPPAKIEMAGRADGPFSGEEIVFTGALDAPRSSAAAIAAALGFRVHDNVRKTTTILVVGQQDIRQLDGYTKSSKHRKAETLIAGGQQLRIIGEEDFWHLAEIHGARPDLTAGVRWKG